MSPPPRDTGRTRRSRRRACRDGRGTRRRRGPLRGAAAAALFATALAGCALTLSGRAPSDYAPDEHGAPSCTDTPGRTVADATLAATYVQLAAWWLVSWESRLLPAPPPELLIPLFALGAGHAASAVYGYNQTLRCKEAQWLYQRSRIEERATDHHPPPAPEGRHDRDEADRPARSVEAPRNR